MAYQDRTTCRWKCVGALATPVVALGRRQALRGETVFAAFTTSGGVPTAGACGAIVDLTLDGWGPIDRAWQPRARAGRSQVRRQPCSGLGGRLGLVRGGPGRQDTPGCLPHPATSVPPRPSTADRWEERAPGDPADVTGDAGVDGVQPAADARAPRTRPDRDVPDAWTRGGPVEGAGSRPGLDESGHQVVVFGRRGARPLTLAEQRRLYLAGRGAVHGCLRSS